MCGNTLSVLFPAVFSGRFGDVQHRAILLNENGLPSSTIDSRGNGFAGTMTGTGQVPVSFNSVLHPRDGVRVIDFSLILPFGENGEFSMSSSAV